MMKTMIWASVLMLVHISTQLGLTIDGTTYKIFGSQTMWYFEVPSGVTGMVVTIKNPNLSGVQDAVALKMADNKYYQGYISSGVFTDDAGATGASPANQGAAGFGTFIAYTASSTATTSQIAVTNQNVYPFCIYTNFDSTKALNTSQAKYVSCGNYHTFTYGSGYTTNSFGDRNLGKYQKSGTFTSSTTSNTYNVTFYGNTQGNFLIGDLNAGVTVQRTAGTATFGIWLAASPSGDKNYDGQDFITVHPFTAGNSPAIGDSYAANTSAYSRDNDTTKFVATCADNVNGISAGAGTTYVYGHASRGLISTDVICDSQIVNSVNIFCIYFTEGATATAYTVETTNKFC